MPKTTPIDSRERDALRMRPSLPVRAVLAALLVAAACARADDDDPAKDDVRTTRINEVISQIDAVGGFGGGNVAVSSGPDGVLLVDTMSKGIVPKLKAELARIAPSPVRIVVNTHFHLDHAGGNAAFGDAATIIANETVRTRLAAARMPAAGLPKITYAGDAAPTLHFNGEDIRLMHCPAAHTDGDTIVVFESSKVVHLGDLYFSGMFPAVYRQGGDWKGLIACLDAIVPKLPDDATVIAGHGPMTHMPELRAYVAMLKDTTAIVEAHLAAGETVDAMNAKRVLAKYDALGSGGAQSTDQYLAMLVKLLSPPDGK
jgi:glyoxylase-like metal-dependent hydrolase (beta-lactamase superfamily II)